MPAGYWIIRSYEAGIVGEKVKFWIPEKRHPKSFRKKKTEPRKQEQNEYNTERRLARLINANCDPGWVLLGMDYSETGMDRLCKQAMSSGGGQSQLPQCRADMKSAPTVGCEEAIKKAAEREMRLALRRVGRELLKRGADLKYIAVTSDMDGETGETVRIHHHLLVPEEACEIFARKWKILGRVHWDRLQRQDDYTPIAAYLIRQARYLEDAKKFTCSQNLVRPLPKDRIAFTDAELRVPRGAKLLHRSEFKPGAPQYIRFVFPDTTRTRGGGRKGQLIIGNQE